MQIIHLVCQLCVKRKRLQEGCIKFRKYIHLEDPLGKDHEINIISTPPPPELALQTKFGQDWLGSLREESDNVETDGTKTDSNRIEFPNLAKYASLNKISPSKEKNYIPFSKYRCHPFPPPTPKITHQFSTFHTKYTSMNLV